MSVSAPSDPSPPILRIRGVSKGFGSLLANADIGFELRRGEVLALLGENGAGKSTLVSILFGHYVADAGTIEVDGVPLPPGQPKAALAAGIGMVHQHFTLAHNLSVLDNVMLGTEPLWRPVSRRAQARTALLEAARRFGLHVDPETRVGDLSVSERQRVEILKALVEIGHKRGARILILDEPTAVLTPQESEALFATLARMVQAGLAIIFISHKLDEVLRIAHHIVVLRAGRVVARLDGRTADRTMLAEAMVGRAVAPAVKRAHAAGTCIGRLRNVSWAARPDGASALRQLTLDLSGGEIVAIAGVAGNGQQALAALMCGEAAPDAGTIEIDGRVLPPRPRAWVQAGVARIPEDRQGVGVIGDLSVWENVVLERYASPALARGGWLRRAAARRQAQRVIEAFDVRGTEARGVETPVRALSGGNVQKLVLGRALAGAAGAARGAQAGADGALPAGKDGSQPGGEDRDRPAGTPRLVIAEQPTWGLDIGAVAYVHQQLLDAAAAGAAVLLISEDLDEILALADRIAVMHAGRLTAALPAAAWTLESIGLAMGGAAGAPALHDAA